MQNAFFLVIALMAGPAWAFVPMQCRVLIYEGKTGLPAKFSALLDPIELDGPVSIEPRAFVYYSSKYPGHTLAYKFFAADATSQLARGFRVELKRTSEKVHVGFFLTRGEESIGTTGEFPLAWSIRAHGNLTLVANDVPVELALECAIGR